MIPVALKAKTEYPWECCGTAESLHFQRSELFDWRSIWNGFAPGMVPQRKDDWSCKIKLKNKSDFWTWGYAKYFSYYLDTTKKVWNWNSIKKGKILKFGYFWSCPKNSKQLFRYKLKWKLTFYLDQETTLVKITCSTISSHTKPSQAKKKYIHLGGIQ